MFPQGMSPLAGWQKARKVLEQQDKKPQWEDVVKPWLAAWDNM